LKKLVLLLLLICFLSNPIYAQAAPTTFFYVVTAVDANGQESAFSGQVTATLKQGMTRGVILTWLPTAPVAPQLPAASFNVYRSTTSGSGYVKINTSPVGSGSPTFTDPFVAPPAPSGLTAVVS